MELERALRAFCMGALLGAATLTAQAQQGADGEWPMAAHDYANTRYSPLDQITPANAAQLKLVFSFPMGVERGQEAAPVVAPYPNVLYALDRAKPEAPLK
jgi:glucose dehydrogenase